MLARAPQTPFYLRLLTSQGKIAGVRCPINCRPRPPLSDSKLQKKRNHNLVVIAPFLKSGNLPSRATYRDKTPHSGIVRALTYALTHLTTARTADARCAMKCLVRPSNPVSPLLDIQKGESQKALPFLWSRRRDSNPRPLGPEPSALPSALRLVPDYYILFSISRQLKVNQKIKSLPSENACGKIYRTEL